MAFDQADYFLIPLLNGAYGVGQVFEVDDVPDDVVFAGLSHRIAQPGTAIAPLHLDDIVAIVRAAASPINDGTWPLAGFDQIPKFRDIFDYDATAALAFPNHPIHDPAIIEAFLSAWHGLYDWAAFGDLFETIKRPDLDRPAAAT